MINTHILNLQQEVPKEIRLEVYIKAKEYLLNPIDTKGYGLCMILPVLLWDLDNFLLEAPDGEDWSYRDTHIAFPELTKKVLNTLSLLNSKESKAKRIEYINQFIKDLTTNTK